MGRWLGVVGVWVVLAGCGDSGGGSASMSSSDGQTGTTAATEVPTSGTTAGSMSDSMTEGNEGGISISMSGTTGAEGGISDSVSASGGSSESVSGSGTTGAETTNVSGGGETSASTGVAQTTGEPIVCSEIEDEQGCLAADCMAVKGRQIKDDFAIACIEDVAVFLGCLDPMACAEVITTVCKGDAQYQLPNSCYPQGFTECEPPPDQGGDGYPACM